uniref:Uncharacterized protein n=2 Tax=Opuntia streptacantha TaxID=393608 RepID=A0A7C9EBV1_OPUST
MLFPFLEDKGKKLSSETSNDIHLPSSRYLHNNTNCLQTFTKHFHILNRVSSSYIVPPATGEQLNNEKSQQHKIESRRGQQTSFFSLFFNCLRYLLVPLPCGCRFKGGQMYLINTLNY